MLSIMGRLSVKKIISASFHRLVIVASKKLEKTVSMHVELFGIDNVLDALRARGHSRIRNFTLLTDNLIV